MPHLVEAVQHHLGFSTMNMYHLLDLFRLKAYHRLDFLFLLLIDDTFWLTSTWMNAGFPCAASLPWERNKNEEKLERQLCECVKDLGRTWTHWTKNSRTTPQHSPSSAQLVILSPIIASSPHWRFDLKISFGKSLQPVECRLSLGVVHLDRLVSSRRSSSHSRSTLMLHRLRAKNYFYPISPQMFCMS